MRFTHVKCTLITVRPAMPMSLLGATTTYQAPLQINRIGQLAISGVVPEWSVRAARPLVT